MSQSVSIQPDTSEVRQALDHVLESVAFRGSKRCQDFLHYVVTQVLAGNGDTLKERTLAAEVFHRKALSAIGGDSIVRVGAREVRKRLAQYYVTAGAQDPIRIELPPGSYVPVFRLAASSTVATQIIATELQTAALVGAERQVLPGVRPRNWLIAAVTVVVLGAGVFFWQSAGGESGEFEDFWKPALDPQKPLLIALAHPIVYNPSTHAYQLNEVKNGRPARALQYPLQLPPETLNGSDFVPVFDQYVGFGDTVAASQLAALFTRSGRQARIRLASKVEFADLRDSAVVLIGAFTNRWTIELTESFRFRFVLWPKPALVDANGNRQWVVADKSDDGRTTNDYILLSRLRTSQTGGFVVVGAGLTQYGTQEAGRILAEPASLVPILKALPADWRTRNVQVVLHARIVEDSPAAPEVVTWHVW